MKRVLRLDAARRLAAWLGAQYIRFVHRTVRWTVQGGDIPDRLRAEGRPFIVCFWHSRLLMMPLCWKQGQIVRMLISTHRDGRLISAVAGHFGYQTIEGSTNRGGSSALRSMVKVLQSGGVVGVTPDGPRGPRMRAASGVAGAARLSGAPIVTVTYSTSRRRLLGSWDRFLVPLPFGRGVVLWGEPIPAPAGSGAAVEAVRRATEDRLNELTAEADRLCGHLPTEPAPAGDAPR